MKTDQPLSLSQIMAAILRHKVRASATFVVVMIVVVFAFLVWPRKYYSEGRLYVQLGRTNTSLDPVPGGNSVSIQDTRETEILSVVELLKSRAVVESVVDDVGAEQILASPLDKYFDFGLKLPKIGGSTAGDAADEFTAEEYQRLKNRERAVKKLQSDLVIYAEKKTPVICIDCSASNSQLAQRIVDSIMQNMKEKHLGVHAISGSTKFFMAEYERQEKVLDDAVQRLEEFRNENSFLSIEGATATLQQVIDRLAQSLMDAEADVAQSKERVRQIQEEMAQIEPTIHVPTKGVEKLSYEESYAEYFRLQGEAEQLKSTLTANHPRIVAVETQMRQLADQLKQMSQERTESVTEVNPIYEAIKIDLVRAVASQKSDEARLEQLRKQRQDSLADLQDLNKKIVIADRHQREVDVARRYLDIYIQKRGEATVMNQLDEERISDIVVAQDASLILKAASPRGSVFLPLGAIFAALCGIAVALLAERDMFRAAPQDELVEQVSEIPVLINLPRVPSRRYSLS
jgi:uncharacterized protein involved in exopolysaccharide biosynthesis